MSEASSKEISRHVSLVQPESAATESSWTNTEIATGAALSVAAMGVAIAARKPIAGAVRSALSMAASETKAILPELKVVGSETGLLTQGAKSGASSLTRTPFSSLGEPFQESGRLVSGTHRLSWDELVRHFGTTPERQVLLERFKPIAHDLKAAKVDSVEIGGSFASKKPAPKDIDFAWNNEQPGFSPLRLRWRQPDLMTAETDALQYRGLHNVNGAKGANYPDALQFLRKVKIEPKVDVDVGKIKSHAELVELGELRRQARIDAAMLEEQMRAAGTLHRNGLLSLDLKSLPK